MSNELIHSVLNYSDVSYLLRRYFASLGCNIDNFYLNVEASIISCPDAKKASPKSTDTELVPSIL